MGGCTDVVLIGDLLGEADLTGLNGPAVCCLVGGRGDARC